MSSRPQAQTTVAPVLGDQLQSDGNKHNKRRYYYIKHTNNKPYNNTLTTLHAEFLSHYTSITEGFFALLVKAIHANDIRMVQEILERVDVNDAPVDLTPDSDTPLTLAVKKLGRLEIVQLLLDNGANVDFHHTHFPTALMWAAAKGFTVYCRLLLQAGADVNLTLGQYGDDTKQKTIEMSDDVKSFLWKGIRLRPQNGPCVGHNALTLASREGHGDVVNLLVMHGADLSASSLYMNRPALMWALFFGHAHIVDMLLSHGANVESVDRHGNTPLIWASCKGEKQTCVLLLRHHANINAKNKLGETALMDAASMGCLDVCDLLLSHGADVNARDTEGHSALEHAEAEKNHSVVDLLRRHGAV